MATETSPNLDQHKARRAILMVAGEASADLHGSLVVERLKERDPDLLIFGIGGPLMEAKGFVSIVKSSEISVMGLTEVLLALPRIFRAGRRLLAAADEYQPAAAILLDLPDFNLRLAPALKRRHIPILYYISPQVWAWRRGRIKKIRRLVDKMLVILPFEEELYKSYNVPVSFVGHPLVEEQDNLPDKAAARRKLELPAAGQVVALLPGSRKSEINRHLGRLLAAARILANKPDIGPLTFVIPMATKELSGSIKALTAEYNDLDLHLVDGEAQSVILASDVAAVCSGTATLQTALLGCPLVVFYRLSAISYFLLARLVKVAAISLVNLIAGHQVVDELIQNEFTPLALASRLSELLQNKEHYRAMQEELLRLKWRLGEHKTSLAVAAQVEPYLQSFKGALNERSTHE